MTVASAATQGGRRIQQQLCRLSSANEIRQLAAEKAMAACDSLQSRRAKRILENKAQSQTVCSRKQEELVETKSTGCYFND